METEIKKPKNGFDRLKVKYAKLKAEKEELQTKVLVLEQKCSAKELAHRSAEALEKAIKEHDETIRKQGTKISTLTADLANARGEAREYRNKFEEAVRRMGWLRRFIYGYNRPPFTDEDHWHD